MIKLFNPIYSNDLFISGILPKSLTPPHTALSIKKYLYTIEGLAGSNTSLFESLSSDIAIADFTHLTLCGHLGAGSLSHEPMALVVRISEADKRSDVPLVSNKLFESPDLHETRYGMSNVCVVVLNSQPI